jgi:hypothetical protein
MEVVKGVELEYKEGKLVLSAGIAALLNPVLEDYKAKIESGEIDLIKGTDLDKMVVLQVIAALQAEVNK